MVQESTNTFSDGLIKDLNPLTTPNTVLTDALNATLITLNGNELVLQNDMGNTKLNGSELKEGYNPIGVKEHGGILYIVSKHPDGNVEIGSFPSPEYKEVKEDINLLNSIEITESGENLNSNIILNSAKINPGDKFLLAFNINDLTLINEQFGNKNRNYYKFKLLSVLNGIETDITNTLSIQEKWNDNTDTFESTNYWFVPLVNNEVIDINFYNVSNKLQTYKNKKGGSLVLRIELENIDEFKIDNGADDNSEFPKLITDNLNNKILNFNLYSKFESKIKPNRIDLSLKVKDKTTLEEVKYLRYNVFNSDLIDNYLTSLDVNLGNSINKIVEYNVLLSNTTYDINFDEFTIKNIIDLTKDPLSWGVTPFWKAETAYTKTDNTYNWYYIIGLYAYIDNVLTKLNSNYQVITSQTGEHAAYRLLSIETDPNFQEYDIIGTFEIDNITNLSYNFKDLLGVPVDVVCTDIIKYKPELTRGYLYNGFSLLPGYYLNNNDKKFVSNEIWRIPTSQDLDYLSYYNANSLKYSGLEWNNEGTNDYGFSSLKLGSIHGSILYTDHVGYWGETYLEESAEFITLTEGDINCFRQSDQLGSGYAIRLICDLQDQTNPLFTPPIDYNGYSYSFVTLGTLLIMSEDLRTNKFNDGTDIDNSLTVLDFSNKQIPSFINNPS